MPAEGPKFTLPGQPQSKFILQVRLAVTPASRHGAHSSEQDDATLPGQGKKESPAISSARTAAGWTQNPAVARSCTDPETAEQQQKSAQQTPSSRRRARTRGERGPIARGAKRGRGPVSSPSTSRKRQHTHKSHLFNSRTTERLRAKSTCLPHIGQDTAPDGGGRPSQLRFLECTNSETAGRRSAVELNSRIRKAVNDLFKHNTRRWWLPPCPGPC